MISWINGELVESWQTNQKFFVLINCQGLGYEIQILESFFLKLKTNQISNKKITLWLKHIKKEDSDLLFGFTSKEQRNFFIEILTFRGVGSQIGMGILNKFTIGEVINAIKTQNKKLICSVPGIGQKMTNRFRQRERRKASEAGCTWCQSGLVPVQHSFHSWPSAVARKGGQGRTCSCGLLPGRHF